jgi:hypothetical protein
VLEVRQVQPQQMAQYLAAEDGVDPVPRVQHEVLAQPAHAGVEQQEHAQPQRDHDQRVGRLVHHHLVDDDLREERRGEGEQLDEQRSEQHVAPHALVLEELGPEPRPAEARSRRRALLD